MRSPGREVTKLCGYSSSVELDPDYAVPSCSPHTACCNATTRAVLHAKLNLTKASILRGKLWTQGEVTPRVLLLAGTVLAHLARDREMAITAFGRALPLNSNSAQVWRMSGWVRLLAGDRRTVAEYLSHSIHLSPRGPDSPVL